RLAPDRLAPDRLAPYRLAPYRLAKAYHGHPRRAPMVTGLELTRLLRRAQMPAAEKAEKRASGDQPADGESGGAVGRALVLDAGSTGNGETARLRRGTAPAGKPEIAAYVPGGRAECVPHHLSVVERAPEPPHAVRARLHPGAPAAQPHRHLRHVDGTHRSDSAIGGHPYEDDARFYHPGRDQPAGSCLPPDELSALGADRGRGYRQFGKPALRGDAIPGGGRQQAAARLRGHRPRPVQARRSGRGPCPGGVIWRHEALRVVRLDLVAV